MIIFVFAIIGNKQTRGAFKYGFDWLNKSIISLVFCLVCRMQQLVSGVVFDQEAKNHLMIVFRQFSDVFQAFLGFNQVGTCLKDYFFITDSTLFQFFTEKNCLFGPFGHENPNENYFPRIFINLNFCAKNVLLTVPFLHLLGNGHFWVMPCICF